MNRDASVVQPAAGVGFPGDRVTASCPFVAGVVISPANPAELATTTMAFPSFQRRVREGRVKVYAVVGVPPEVQAYAMAKYSRSAQSMPASIGEISTQRAEQFLNTFYFQYGHRSIADLAHLVLGVEDVS